MVSAIKIQSVFRSYLVRKRIVISNKPKRKLTDSYFVYRKKNLDDSLT